MSNAAIFSADYVLLSPELESEMPDWANHVLEIVDHRRGHVSVQRRSYVDGAVRLWGAVVELFEDDVVTPSEFDRLRHAE